MPRIVKLRRSGNAKKFAGSITALFVRRQSPVIEIDVILALKEQIHRDAPMIEGPHGPYCPMVENAITNGARADDWTVDSKNHCLVLSKESLVYSKVLGETVIHQSQCGDPRHRTPTARLRLRFRRHRVVFLQKR